MTSALCGVLLATAAHGLAPPPQPIRKVAIVGSGIAGLSLAQALENSPNLQGNGEPIEVTVYDSRPSLNYEAGAGVQLNGGEILYCYNELMDVSKVFLLTFCTMIRF